VNIAIFWVVAPGCVVEFLGNSGNIFHKKRRNKPQHQQNNC
jgi:hypothetical protein